MTDSYHTGVTSIVTVLTVILVAVTFGKGVGIVFVDIAIVGSGGVPKNEFQYSHNSQAVTQLYSFCFCKTIKLYLPGLELGAFHAERTEHTRPTILVSPR